MTKKITEDKIARYVRIASNFDKELLEIQRIRSKKGFLDPRDSKTNSVRRITEAIPRHSSWPLIKEAIIKAPLNKVDLT